jgi:hypothetical protein
METIDHHAHFTGSLPAGFIGERARGDRRFAELQCDLFKIIPDCVDLPEGQDSDVGTLLAAIRSVSGRLPAGWFYRVYQALQRATHPASDAPELKVYDFYRAGFEAILKSRTHERLDVLQLFVSAGRSIERLDIKMRALTDACWFAKSPEIAVRITLPRTATLQVKDSGDLVSQLIGRLSSGSATYSRVIGIDVSGDEVGVDWSVQTAALRELIDFRSTYRSPLSVSIHLGENLWRVSAPTLLEWFDDALSLGVDSIGHGVFAWIPESSLKLHESVAHLLGFEEQRRQLVHRMLETATTIELCPSTMLLTQPWLRVEDLPTRLPSEFRPPIAVGTDSPALFATTLCKELAVAGAQDACV